MGKTYTGVDIGNYSLKLVVSDGVSIKHLAVVPLPEGLVTEDRIVSFDAMADFIKQTASDMGGASREVAVLLPRSLSLTRRLHIPAMTEKELEINLPYEFRDFIQQGKDKYFFDYAVLATQTDAKGIPESMDLLAVAAAKQVIEDYQEMFKRASMKLRIALPHQAALQNLMGGNSKALANCCIADFSHESTKLHFFVSGAYDVTRTIDIGSIDVDRAIAQTFGVDEHIANGYKHANFEGALTCDQAMLVYESIAVELGRALHFYGFNNPDSLIEVVYCCGGGASVEPLMNAVVAQTDVELRDIASILPEVSEDNQYIITQCPAAVGAVITD
ncbi:MAG: pilus assembly protein PilM [Gordonibacter sp.]|uniref:pilus assembly protein PilM n=1 Tax=Gordonibacter sp. TaxID=1968902 RepID=UPI002FC59033